MEVRPSDGGELEHLEAETDSSTEEWSDAEALGGT